STRIHAFFWLSMFIASACVYALTFNAYLMLFFCPDYPYFYYWILVASGYFSAASGLMFYSCSLDLRGKLKVLRRVLRGAATLNALIACVAWVAPLDLMLPLSTGSMAFNCLLIVAISLLAYTRQS